MKLRLNLSRWSLALERSAQNGSGRNFEAPNDALHYRASYMVPNAAARRKSRLVLGTDQGTEHDLTALSL